MPLEGHWARVNTPVRSLTRREWRVVAGVGALLAVSLAIALYVALASSSPKSDAGCVDVPTGSTMGGATIHACGGAAKSLCRSKAGQPDVFARAVQEHCREAGIG